MEKRLPVQCLFSGEEDILTILRQSFDLYLIRMLREHQERTE